MSISAIEKKHVTQSWLHHFSDLRPYSNVKFYKVLGPAVIGIELIKLPRSDEYRPHFVVYSLVQTSPHEFMETPLIYREIIKRNGRQLDIPYTEHDKWENEAFECVEEQGIRLTGDIKNGDLFNFIDVSLQTGIRGQIPEAKAYALKLFAAIYIGDWHLTEEILDELSVVGKTWNPAGFDFLFGPFDQWYKSLEDKSRDRELFLSLISRSLESSKLSKLNRSELLP